MRSLIRIALWTLLFLVVAAANAQTPQGSKLTTFSGVVADSGVALTSSNIVWHRMTWKVSGTVTTCTVALDSSSDGASWTAGGVISGQTCTTNGTSSLVNVNVNFVRMNMTALTGGGTVNVTWTGFDVPPPLVDAAGRPLIAASTTGASVLNPVCLTTTNGTCIGSLSVAALQLQPATLKNTETVSGANAAQTVSIAAVANQRVFLYSVNARCSAGTSSVTVKDGVAGTVIWTTAATEVGTTSLNRTFPVPLTSSNGNGMDVVVATCGVGNTSTIDVQASQL